VNSFGVAFVIYRLYSMLNLLVCVQSASFSMLMLDEQRTMIGSNLVCFQPPRDKITHDIMKWQT